jgi:RNA-directed DNA polymerase
MNSLWRFIERRLRLMVNEEKSAVTGPNDLTFLGFHLGRNTKGEITVAISQRTKDRMDTRIRELTPRVWGQSISMCIDGINRYLRGWIGYFRLCTEDRLTPLHKFDAHIRRRLRAIIIRHKKRPRHLYRHLLACGVPRKNAAQAAYRRVGIWRRSASHGIHQAYPNAWFAQRLLSLEAQWHVLSPSWRALVKQCCLFET